MEFWALEHANNATLFLFAFIVIGFFMIGCIVTLTDYIKRKIKKKMKKKNRETEIVLRFTKSNNFCSVQKKHGTSGNHKEIANNALWVINCAASAIQRSYSEGAPHRIEMDELREDLINQL